MSERTRAGHRGVAGGDRTPSGHRTRTRTAHPRRGSAATAGCGDGLDRMNSRCTERCSGPERTVLGGGARPPSGIPSSPASVTRRHWHVHQPPPRGRATGPPRAEVPPLAPAPPRRHVPRPVLVRRTPAEQDPTAVRPRGTTRPGEATARPTPRRRAPGRDLRPRPARQPTPPLRPRAVPAAAARAAPPRRPPLGQSDRRTAWSDRRPGDERGPAREAAWHRDQPDPERYDGRPRLRQGPQAGRVTRAHRRLPRAPEPNPVGSRSRMTHHAGVARRKTGRRPRTAPRRRVRPPTHPRPRRPHRRRGRPVGTRGRPHAIPRRRVPGPGRRRPAPPGVDLRRPEALPRGRGDRRGALTQRWTPASPRDGPADQPRLDDDRRRPDTDPHRQQPREAAARAEAYPDRRPASRPAGRYRDNGYREDAPREDAYREARPQPGQRSDGGLPWPAPGSGARTAPGPQPGARPPHRTTRQPRPAPHSGPVPQP